jgi:hypothetical protein
VAVLAHKVQPAQMEQQIPAAVAERLTFKEMHLAQAVQESLSSAIQTHSEPPQAQRVRQQSPWLEALGSTNIQLLVQLLSKVRHGHQTISRHSQSNPWVLGYAPIPRGISID